MSPPTDYVGEAGGPVEYDVNALRLALPNLGHPRRGANVSLSAAIPASAPERLSHVFATIRASRFARTPAGQAFLAQLAKLPQPISGTFALPRVTLNGPPDKLTTGVELSGGDLSLAELKIEGLTAQLGYTAGARPSGSVKANVSNLLAAGVPFGPSRRT